MKLDRYDGEVPIFSEDYEGRERTIFGSATESNNINDQFTPEFMRGWGIVGDTEFPTLQDFNALGFTLGKLISYLYQAGIPSYTANEKYYPGSIVQYNNDIYLCTATEPTSLPTDVRDWVKWQSSLGELAQIRADKNGFLLNKAGTYNALIDTDLVQATGQSQTKIMTQKAITDALAQKQNNLTFVGTGPEVMRKGAYGLGERSKILETQGDFDNLPLVTQFFTVSGSWINSPFPDGTDLAGVCRVISRQHNAGTSLRIDLYMGNTHWVRELRGGVWTEWVQEYSGFNTRTDKNRVLHAGTGTPINTLNVSDMNQDVIDNDNLTVTSGAVYRALLPKRDLTDNEFEGTQINLRNNGFASINAYSSSVNRRLGLVTGGNGDEKNHILIADYDSNRIAALLLREKSGTVALLSDLFGAGQSWQDVTGSRSTGTTYTNNTGKLIELSINWADTLSPQTASLTVNGVTIVSNQYDKDQNNYGTLTISASIPAGATYRATGNAVNLWAELR